MRVDRTSPRRLGGCALFAAVFATVLVAGCRTTGGSGKVTAMATPPALQTTVTSVEATEIASLPEGPAKTLVTERCLLCHGPALITQQRKDAAAWGRAVTQMRTWGTPIQDEDQAAIVAYLTQHFGPNAARR
jgi:cytochrome c5